MARRQSTTPIRRAIARACSWAIPRGCTGRAWSSARGRIWCGLPPLRQLPVWATHCRRWRMELKASCRTRCRVRSTEGGRMHNRREFVKEMVAGVAVLGTGTNFALGEAKPAQKSRVVIVRDAKLRTPGPGPDATRMAAMLDHAMQTYFHTQNPLQPWKEIVRPGQVIGLKVNTLGRALSPNPALVAAICERLQQAGIKAGDII